MSVSPEHPIGILLAAGYGRRFGSDKLLAPLPDGTPIGLAAARNLQQGLELAFAQHARALAVLRPEQDELAHLLKRQGFRLVITNQAQRGMGASLAAGVAASIEAAGWIVALGDMPFLKPGTIASVARALSIGASLAAPAVWGRRGHPVGFASVFATPLRELDGDQGARALLGSHPVTLITCDDAGALRDVDTPADLAS